MGLPNLYQPPEGQRGWQEYWFNHFQDHVEIVQAIRKQLNIDLPVYIIDPWSEFDQSGILERHTQFHNDMNLVLGIPGNDLSTVDFKKANEVKAWVYLNYTEHQNAHASLAI